MYSTKMDHQDERVWYQMNQHHSHLIKPTRRQDESIDFNSVIPLTLFSVAAFGLASLLPRQKIGKNHKLLLSMGQPV